MSLPDYFRTGFGTPIIWGEAGATAPAVTLTMSLDALASGAAWAGAYADLGANPEPLYFAALWIESGTAPIAGNVAELHLACTHDTSYWPAGVSGSDGQYKSGEEREWLNHLSSFVTNLIATNDGNTLQRSPLVPWVPSGRYVSPIAYNTLGQAVRNQTTNSDNKSRVILVPQSLILMDT